MKNFIVFVVLILIIITSLIFNFVNSKSQIDTFIDLKEHIYQIKGDVFTLEKNTLLNKNNEINTIKAISQLVETIYQNNYTIEINDKIKELKKLKEQNTTLLLEKIEELTLRILELDRQMKILRKQVED